MKIEKITIVTMQGVDIIQINVNNIYRIEDKSLEYENHIHTSYHCFDKNNNLVKCIENCPVVIDYIKK